MPSTSEIHTNMQNCKHHGEDLNYVLVELDLTVLALKQGLLDTVRDKTKAKACEIQIIGFIFFLSCKCDNTLKQYFLSEFLFKGGSG